MAIHVMGDIETLSTANNPVLLMIGAVKFNKTEIIDRFHVGIEPADGERYGLKIDAKTVMWWFDPKRDEARKLIWELPKIDLFAALDGFDMWVKQTPADQLGSFWGKGATFDNVKLKSAYDAVGLDYPFHYRQDECYRTMANRAPDVVYEQLGVAHWGVDDAESQAVHLQHICAKYGIEL